MKSLATLSSAALVFLVIVSPACKTVDKVNNTIDSAKTAVDNVNALAKNFNDTLNQLKAQAKTPTTAAPISAASVPALPPRATGSVDTIKPVAGKSGSGSADVEGSGTPETVQVFEADSSTVSTQSLHALDFATSDDATTFLSWKGDAESGDEGQCYLGWEHQGKVWFIISACGANTGHVCSDDGTTATCSACNEAGGCTECDENQPLSACTVQAQEPDAGAYEDAAAGGDAP
jgi:hypothetical protein